MTQDKPSQEYVFRGVNQMDRGMQQRRASESAAFLLPHLKPGMSLVDVGCGQGTITAGLAEAVAPGEVVGFDLQTDHLDRAVAFAKEHGLTNLTFRFGDVFDPPCEPESFDIAYANAVLSHLEKPDEALESIWRILKPGGLVALRDRGGGYVVSGSSDENVQAAREEFELMAEATEATSRSPYGSQRIGEVLNQLCRKAGFQEPMVSATWGITTSAEWAARGNDTVLPGGIAERVVEIGRVSRQELEALDEKCRRWLEDPDGYMAAAWFEVVAHKP